ncbi:HAMP domain-containing sensor histidine kinase [Streptomyces gilvifuscus]|uniref:histidine kinase n=1 Tax=Streptomyces gilvifuscus TaxID=1550617 RepID=A0ABT5FVM5_9ACTN|nr:HAMP domain-containing sensor histidine kinase [Streptomyces gilvifuscus]MDC2956609.1 HAMP domain-containing sensor histidine kinase [Streptomyces gilvifuscus]
MTRRLLLSYLVLALLVLAVLEIPLGIIYARGETSRASQRVERDAAMLAEITEENIEKGRLDMLPDVAGDYAERTGGRVIVTDKHGIVLADSDPLGTTGISLAAQPDIARALNNRPTVTTTDGNGTDVLSATMPGSSGTTIRGTLRLTCPLDQVTTRVHRVWSALALAGVCILAAVALVAFSLARWITRPLRTLAAATAQLADGHLHDPPDATTGPPELRSLTASFTHTATRLQHLLKAQQAFASEASHQLKTPLTALRLRLENFEPYLDQRAHASLDEAVGEVERLGRMVQGLLALARLENAATTPEPADLDAVLADRAAMWESLAAEQFVTVDLTGAPVGHVWAIPGALEQIIDNLLANALRVSPPGIGRSGRISQEQEWKNQSRYPSGWPWTSIELQYSACEVSAWRRRRSGLSLESSHRPSCNGLSGESMRCCAKRYAHRCGLPARARATSARSGGTKERYSSVRQKSTPCSCSSTTASSTGRDRRLSSSRCPALNTQSPGWWRSCTSSDRPTHVPSSRVTSLRCMPRA